MSEFDKNVIDDEKVVKGWDVSISENNENNAPRLVIVSSKSRPDYNKFTFPVQVVKGIVYPPWCSEQRWNDLSSRIVYRSSDVLVVSYPKCGTTWAEQCALLLLNKNYKHVTNPADKNVYKEGSLGKIWPEACIEQRPDVHEKTGKEMVPILMDVFDNAPSPRIIKSHAPVSHILGASGEALDSLPKGIKVIVVTRNPLDACVSCYFHAWNPAKSGWPFPAWAAAWFNGFVPHGDWFYWVRDWASYSRGDHGNNIHWVQFEDLKANPEETVQKLADFLGVGDDKELVQSAIEDSSFESMKEKATSQGEKECAHLRKGVSGDWRNYFSDELAQEFVEKYNTVLSGTGITYSLGAGEKELTAP